MLVCRNAVWFGFLDLCWTYCLESRVMEWVDYEKKSPRIDGRYQIFISGEQLAADYKHPLGFACPIDGCAFVQELITHWAVLNNDPVIELPEEVVKSLEEVS